MREENARPAASTGLSHVVASRVRLRVVLPYLYDAGKLEDRLAVLMPREQVLKNLGKPDRVVRDDGQQAMWEYGLYPQGEWLGYLFHCPFFPNCYFPAEPANTYYVVLQENQLCMWGRLMSSVLWPGKSVGRLRGGRISADKSSREERIAGFRDSGVHASHHLAATTAAGGVAGRWNNR